MMRFYRKLWLVIIVFLLVSWTMAQEEEERVSIAKLLKELYPPETGVKIIVDPVTQQLTIIATEEQHREIERLIGEWDIGPTQVTIEAKFIEINVSDIGELSAQLTGLTGGLTGDVGGIIGGSGAGEASFDVGLPSFTTEGGTFRYTRLTGTAFRLILHALESQEKVNMLSAPRVTTLSNQTAMIDVTQTVPYASDYTRTNIGTAEDPIWQDEFTVEEERAGITLEVTPIVQPGSTLIQLEITPRVNVVLERITTFSAVPEALGWPVIDTRTTHTNVMIKSGETIVLGGLIRDEDRKIEKKVPILSSIPVLGRLFRSDYTRTEKKNLIIFITAYLVDTTGKKITEF